MMFLDLIECQKPDLIETGPIENNSKVHHGLGEHV